MRTKKATAAALKKDHERWALDRFLVIEMTDLYWSHTRAGRPRQEQESLRRRIVKAAEELYAGRGLPPVHVPVHFNDQFVVGKTAVTLLAAQMADWAAARVPRIGGSFEEQYGWVNRDYFPEQLHALRIYRYDSVSRTHFSAPDAAYVPQLTVADVERTLESKNSRHRTYLRKCDEAWLVVSLNAARLSMTFQIGDAITETVYETPFSRAFLLQHIPPHLSELKRTNGDPRDA